MSYVQSVGKVSRAHIMRNTKILAQDLAGVDRMVTDSWLRTTRLQELIDTCPAKAYGAAITDEASGHGD